MRLMRAHPLASATLAAPLLLAAYYMAASWLPARWAAPPAYDLLYMTNYAPGAMSGLRYEIKNQRLRLMYAGENFGFGWARLFRFNPASGQVREIRILWPRDIPPVPPAPRATMPGQQSTLLRPVPVETDRLKVSDAPASPDGFRFEPIVEGKEDLSLMFSPPTGPLLGYVVKEGRRIGLPAPPGPRTHIAVQFVGWVLS